MRASARIRVFGCIAILAFSQTFALAQGAMVGYTATDRDDPGGAVGNTVYRIDLTNPGATVALGSTNVPQELEGFFSIDGPTNSRLFGVAENPDATSTGDPSVLVDLTNAACNPNGLGNLIGETNILFGTEAGSAWDHLSGTVYSIASDDLNKAAGVKLYSIDPSTGGAMEISTTPNMYADGLAVGGNGELYATDARLDDSLYRYNFDIGQFELVGAFGVDLNEDTGLANYRGTDGTGTNLYMITEGDGPNPGRLWSVSTGGSITLIGDIRFADGSEVPEDLEGFDIPWRPLACN